MRFLHNEVISHNFSFFYKQVIKAAKGAEESLKGFQIDKREDLVVQFGAA